jgi:hypothetical protein
MEKGKLIIKIDGTWAVIYNKKVVKNCYGCKPYETFNSLPVLQEETDELGSDKIVVLQHGKEVYFKKVNRDGVEYAVIETPPFVSDDFQIGPDGAYEHEEPEELELGYIDGWDNIFKEIEDSLNSPLPIRVKNWLRNKYHSPVLK